MFIYARSPFIIEADDANQTESKVELFIWYTGLIPTIPQYVLSKLIPASNQTQTYYNVSPYLREYIKLSLMPSNTYATLNTPIPTDWRVQFSAQVYNKVNGLWVYSPTQSVNATATDGYNYYTQGNVPVSTNNVFNVYLKEGTYLYNYDSDLLDTNPLNHPGLINILINVGDFVTYTNLKTGAQQTTTNSGASGIKMFTRATANFIADGNKVEVYKQGALVPSWSAIFKPICEPKYKPIVVDFIDKGGLWSRIFFQKVSKRSLNVKTNEHKVNPQILSSYDTSVGQIKNYNINGTESIKVNTGWVNDGYADYIQELMFSEKIVLLDPDYTDEFTPVKIKTKSLKKQKGINDGTINYEMEFDFAYDIIGNVI